MWRFDASAVRRDGASPTAPVWAEPQSPSGGALFSWTKHAEHLLGSPRYCGRRGAERGATFQQRNIPMSSQKQSERRVTAEYKGPAGGWGSLRGIVEVAGKEWDSPAVLETLLHQNKPHGFMCVSCSWAKPADFHFFEFCENGAKATLWEATSLRCTPEFFARTYFDGAQRLERFRSRTAGPAHPSPALRSAKRPLCALLLARSL